MNSLLIRVTHPLMQSISCYHLVVSFFLLSYLIQKGREREKGSPEFIFTYKNVIIFSPRIPVPFSLKKKEDPERDEEEGFTAS